MDNKHVILSWIPRQMTRHRVVNDGKTPHAFLYGKRWRGVLPMFCVRVLFRTLTFQEDEP